MLSTEKSRLIRVLLCSLVRSETGLIFKISIIQLYEFSGWLGLDSSRASEDAERAWLPLY